ncbi:unnamed protein product [marine sediment metagenome]|uniref:Uncharacterized protein n=1 Tax=marine sediment metagenome TaxID=412755 RepID=X1ABA3_9ZZZZ
MQANFSLSKEIMVKLTKDKRDSGRDKSATVTRALQRYWLKEVDIEDMTDAEAKIKYSELIDKKQQLEEQIQRVYLRLED